MAGLKRSAKFYSDAVTFQVGGTLFEVSKSYFVEHSVVFKDMFSVPQVEGQILEGSNDEHPIVLENVKANVFETLLSLMYPSPEFALPKPRTKAASLFSGKTQAQRAVELEAERRALIERYSPCIELARRWLFHRLHAGCIERLGASLQPADQIVLGQQHHVPAWIRKGYQQLVERTTKLSKAEAAYIGTASTVGICNLREEKSERKAGYYKSKGGNKIFEDMSYFDIQGIEEVFREELEFADQMERDFYAGAE